MLDDISESTEVIRFADDMINFMLIDPGETRKPTPRLRSFY